ncbi:MAG: carboxypeptidase regulatory-like domain-containing protein, partial [Myxococcota bacterium]
LAAALALWGARPVSPPAREPAPRDSAPAAARAEARRAPLPGRSVSGQVVDAGGSPVPHAEVAAWALGAAPSDRPQVQADVPLQRVRADAEGRYRLTDLPRGPLRLLARGARHAPAVLSLPPGVLTAPDLVLAAGSVLAGQVLRPDGRPAVDAAITLVGSALWPAETLRADADGRFRRLDVPPGIYMVRARLGNDAAARAGVRVTPDGPVEVALRLAPGARFVGDVRDEAGAPIPGAELTLAAGGLSPLPRRAQADDEGAFALAGLLPGRQALEVRAAGHVPLRLPLTFRAGEEQRLTVELVRGATLEGRLWDPQGRPLAGARVRFVGAEPQLAPPPVPGSLGVTAEVPPLPLFGVVESDSWGGLVGAWQSSGRVTSDAEGRFTLAGLRPGAGELVAEAPGLSPAISPGLRLVAGERRGGLELNFTAGALLEGRVLDAKGFPAEGVIVSLQAEREPAPRTLSANADGTFVFEGVLGAATLTARSAALPPARERLVLAEGERRALELRLPEALHAISGRLLDPEETPVPFAVLSVEAENPRTPARRTVPTNADGSFSLAGLPPPPWRLSVRVGSYVPFEQRLPRVPEEPLVLRLQAPVRLTVSVRDAWSGDAPLEGTVRIRSENLPERSLALASARAAGSVARLAVDGLARGERLEVRVEHPGRLPASAELVAGEVDELALELEAAGALRGEVVDRFGEAVSGARVRGPGVGAEVPETRSDGAGRFLLEAVPPGLVTLEVWPPEAAQPAPGSRDEGATEPTRSGPHRVDPLGTTPGIRVVLPVEAESPAEDAPGPEAAALITTGVALTVATGPDGVRIVAVVPGSDAARRGLRPGDVLLAIDGEATLVAGQARSALRGPAGSAATLTLRRGTRRLRRRVLRERHVVPDE